MPADYRRMKFPRSIETEEGRKIARERERERRKRGPAVRSNFESLIELIEYTVVSRCDDSDLGFARDLYFIISVVSFGRF